MHGHMFGGLGILAGSIRDWACIPLSIRLHDGLKAASHWKGASVSCASHVVQMVEDAYRAAETFGDCLLLLDRYFLTVTALERLRALNNAGKSRMEIVTKAKKSCTAFEKPAPKKPGRGRPQKKGAAIHLKELFSSRKEQFVETKAELYGKQETIRYYSIDLLWGAEIVPGAAFCFGRNERGPEHPGKHQPGSGATFHHPPVRLSFPDRMYVSGTEAANWSILLSFLVKAYAKTELLPENRRARPSGASGRRKKPPEYTESGPGYRNAYGAFVYCQGILQSISICSLGKLSSDQLRYQRTPSKGRVSEAALMVHLRKYFFLFMEKQPELRITQIIREQQDKSGTYWDSLAS